jgi:hypothetical protein
MPFFLLLAMLTGTSQPDEVDLQRFTISGLQTLFYARASVEGDVIELRHLASGLAQGGNDLTKGLAAWQVFELPEASGLDRDLPFSQAVKRALRFAFEEADNLGHAYVASEHLFLGLLREGFAIEGLTLDAVREIVRERSRPEPKP